jgi:hypothetical protein
MATSLYRTFRELYRRRWYVAVIWVGLLEMAGFGPSRAPAARFDAGLPPAGERPTHPAPPPPLEGKPLDGEHEIRPGRPAVRAAESAV